MVARLDRNIYRGDTKLFEVALWANRYKRAAFDLTGATLLGQVRADPAGAVLATLVCTALDSIPPTTGKNRLRFELTAAGSAALPLGPVLYDVQATMADARVYTLVAGTFVVEADVSHA